jgi:hypothetical protein
MNSRSNEATSHNVQTVRFAQRHYPQCSVSHNVYSDKNTTQHYIWGEAPQEETLTEKVCAGAAFVACIVVLMFLG